MRLMAVPRSFGSPFGDVAFYWLVVIIGFRKPPLGADRLEWRDFLSALLGYEETIATADSSGAQSAG